MITRLRQNCTDSGRKGLHALRADTNARTSAPDMAPSCASSTATATRCADHVSVTALEQRNDQQAVVVRIGTGLGIIEERHADAKSGAVGVGSARHAPARNFAARLWLQPGLEDRVHERLKGGGGGHPEVEASSS